MAAKEEKKNEDRKREGVGYHELYDALAWLILVDAGQVALTDTKRTNDALLTLAKYLFARNVIDEAAYELVFENVG